jgi:hypothetical protein
MNTSSPETQGEREREPSWLVRGYRVLLWFYPAAHRQKFGPPMDQLFRDQLRDCRSRPGSSSSTARLVFRTFLDFLRSCPAAHWDQFQHRSPMKLNFLGGRASVIAGLVVAALIFSAGAVVTSLIPRTYMSSARFAFQSPRPNPTPGTATLPHASTAVPDPFELNSLLEMTRSMDVLAQVATRLDLATTWSPIYLREGTLQPSEIASILMDKVKARQFRNTSMIEVRVYDRDPALAAKIANGIVEVLREVDSRKRPGVPSSLMLADAAEPGLRPILPNVPLNLVMAALVGLLLGALAMVLIVLLRQLLRHRSRTAAAG